MFPNPENSAEALLKSYAEQSFTCRNATERADCHLDPLCDWDGRTGACYLARDMHSDFTGVVAPCQDLLYSPLSEACWRRKPEPSAPQPCGDNTCRLFPKGSGAGSAHAGGGGEGIPEDRCMLAVEVRHIGVYEVYDMLLRRYGAEQSGKLQGGSGELHKLGFGSCPTAGLHYAMALECRTTERATCQADKSCEVIRIAQHEFCALNRAATVERLMGGSAFAQTVVQSEAACAAASGSRAECLAVGLQLPRTARNRRGVARLRRQA
ncbi:hypothetical protein GPECTOR_5g393 [Gonium pectorale]|uniref:Uncharacterized protein n=1 Tax=Gonium pectorale TaxID=33097 RepID=A0A150GXA0_GONPE|nr:hypothetical protein GPECTOR_5g393 [Gonium pectorale]|eukprot:KXZ54308.1 hypothetical protein GPECTOR_5g393 [Gonium pectorale]